MRYQTDSRETATVILRERFKELPKPIQDIISSTDIRNALQTVSNKHRLHIDQGGMLENVTMMTLIGLYRIDEFETRLAHTLQIDTALATAIANDINASVFAPIREQIRNYTDASAKEAPGTPAQTTFEDKPEIPKPNIPPQTMPANTSNTPKISEESKQSQPKDMSEQKAKQDVATIKLGLTSPQEINLASSQRPVPPDSNQEASKKPLQSRTDPYREPPE